MRILLEVVPTESLLAAVDADADLAGNPSAAEQLTNAGMAVDADWPAMELGPPKDTLGSKLAGRPRFERIKDAVNRVSDTVNRAPFPFELPDWRPERRTMLFRAILPADERDALNALQVAANQARIIAVYNDPEVAVMQRGHQDGARGTAADVTELMACPRLRAGGLTGRGVPVVLVDTGINIAHLRDRGREHEIDEHLSVAALGSTEPPGLSGVGHGTLSAFQVGLAAPEAILADHAVLGRPVETNNEPLIKAWLSDIEPGFARLHKYLTNLPESERRLVVSNSWAMINPDWDFDVAHVENFSDNVEHPFNRMVVALVDAGADVLFAAGNCGEPHPVHNCGFRSQPICGANSLPEVITVGAVDIDGERLGYSSQGPGRIFDEKPDLCGYSHYDGSGVKIGYRPEAVDWGTSTACPGVAGVVAAVRTRYSAGDLSPRDLKALLLQTARRPPGSGYNPDIGYGVVDPGALLQLLP